VEIAISPPGASLDDFVWRLSMAMVTADGPFSMFPGVDRTLTVLEGEGIELSMAGRDPVVLTLGTPPCAFRADILTSARLIGGPIRDLNLMSRRGVVHHELSVLHGGLDEFDVPATGEALIFCASGQASVVIGAVADDLSEFDAVLCPSGHCRLDVPAGGKVFVIRLSRQTLAPSQTA
jgi:hypothetical protein